MIPTDAQLEQLAVILSDIETARLVARLAQYCEAQSMIATNRAVGAERILRLAACAAGIDRATLLGPYADAALESLAAWGG